MKKFHPAFLILSIILLIFGYGLFFVFFLLALLLHEFAHAVVARKLGYKLSGFYLMPYGACLSYQDIFKENDELKIAIAGPLMSLLVGTITVAIWWIFPQTYLFTHTFAICNFALAIFNFLPAFPLDGGRVLINVLSEVMPRKKALKIAIIFNYVFSGLFLLFFLISIFFKINFNFLLIGIFLFVGIFDGYFQAKYLPCLSINKQKMLEKGIVSQILTFSSHVPIFKAIKKFASHKYNFILVLFDDGSVKFLSEDNFRLICERFDSKLSFCDIYKILENNILYETNFKIHFGTIN